MTDGLALHSLLDRFPGRRILCVGDVMLDRFVYGAVERVSGEAPIPILRVGRQSAMLGGAGNVARNVVAMGGAVRLVAAIGDDAAGRELMALASGESGLAGEFVTLAGRPTTVKTRYIAGGQQLLRADEEIVADVSAQVVEEILARVDAALPDCDVVVLSDYAKGVLCDAVLDGVIAAARRAGKPVIADPKRTDLSAYAGVDLLTPNRGELRAASGLGVADDDEVTAAARKVMGEAAIAAMLVTRSEQGASLFDGQEAPLHLPARALEVFDVSGAGDTVVATLAMALAAGAGMDAAARLANIAGGVVVGKVGTATVSRDELAAALLGAEALASEAKVMSHDAAAARLEQWRARGLRVGLTNGCFDLLHPGHVALLSEARSMCDRLVVAINSDESVKRLKGAGRPVQTESARALVLAAMSVVDLVVVFGEDTPIPLLEKLRPDVLIKGGDYSAETVVGADLVTGYGGQVRLTGFLDGHSSTAVIARAGGGE